MPASGSQVWGGGGERGHFPGKKASWVLAKPCKLPRSFFVPKARDLGTTSLAGHKTILGTGRVFRVPFANWVPCLPTAATQDGKAATHSAGCPPVAFGSVNAVPFPPGWGVGLGPSMTAPPYLASFYGGHWAAGP